MKGNVLNALCRKGSCERWDSYSQVREPRWMQAFTGLQSPVQSSYKDVGGQLTLWNNRKPGLHLFGTWNCFISYPLALHTGWLAFTTHRFPSHGSPSFQSHTWRFSPPERTDFSSFAVWKNTRKRKRPLLVCLGSGPLPQWLMGQVKRDHESFKSMVGSKRSQNSSPKENVTP